MKTHYIRKFHEVYFGILSIAKQSARTFGEDRDVAISVAGAQAAALVRTLCEYTLKNIPKEQRGAFLHWLFGQMIRDVTRGRKMKAAIVIKEEES